MHVQTKLPKVGTTIFTVMSQMAMQHQAVNLGQGFPDFPVPEALIDSLNKAMRDGKNQYAPMMGILPLREAIAAKTEACYGFKACPDSEITVTSGASEAIFDAVLAVVRPGDEVIVLDPCYDCYEPAIDLAGGVCVHVPLDPVDFSRGLGLVGCGRYGQDPLDLHQLAAQPVRRAVVGAGYAQTHRTDPRQGHLRAVR